jgi:hypothetical protein
MARSQLSVSPPRARVGARANAAEELLGVGSELSLDIRSPEDSTGISGRASRFAEAMNSGAGRVICMQ